MAAGIAVGLVFALGGDDDKKKTAASAPPPSSSGPVSKSPTTRSPSPTSASPSPSPDDTDNTVEKIAMSPGDCLLFPAGSDQIEKVDCTAPHDAEHVRNLFMPDGPWPGNDAADEQAGELCEQAIEPIVVKQAAPTDYTADYILPNASGWADGDREVQCMVTRRDSAKMTAPLRK